MQGVHLAEQLLDRPAREHGIAEAEALVLAGTGSAQPRHHIRVGFVREIGLRFRLPHLLQQGQVAA